MFAGKKLRIAFALALLWAAVECPPPAFVAPPAHASSRPALSSAPAYRISKTYTTLSFIATKWMVFKEQGIFHDFSGVITFDPRHPEAGSIDVTVQAASIDTQNNTRDAVLRSDDFFDVERYPTLTFRSTTVHAVSADQLEVTGNLMIHGVTKRVTLPVKIIGVHNVPGAGDMAGFESQFTIDRRDFAVMGTRWSGGKLAIDYNVDVHLLIGGVHQ
jgi:polyisoprenoid-binding protein YceI